MEDNIRLKEIKNINKENIITTEDMIIIEAVKKIKNPFINLTVKDVAKDLKMGENLTN